MVINCAQTREDYWRKRCLAEFILVAEEKYSCKLPPTIIPVLCEDSFDRPNKYNFIDSNMLVFYNNTDFYLVSPIGPLKIFPLEGHTTVEKRYDLVRIIKDNMALGTKNVFRLTSIGEKLSKKQIEGTQGSGFLNWKLIGPALLSEAFIDYSR